MINFLKYRSVTALFSLLLVAASAGMFVYKKQTRGSAFTYSVDFTGGTQTLFGFDRPVSAHELTQILEDNGWSSPVMREFANENQVLVRVTDVADDAKGLSERMREAISAQLTDTRVEVLQNETVGSSIGAELRGQSIRAVLFALLAMLIYIAFVFWSYSFALGAIVALLHDALVMLAVFMFLDREIAVSTIAAVLTVVGYSINDTIVIFAQIRKNIGRMSGVPLDEVVNTSLNQTLRRTLLTSLSTALTVGSMFVLGGAALRDFSLALLVGIVFGTYSSIYIASPVMMLLYKKK